MASLNLSDLASRTTSVASKRKKWIKKAVPESHKGDFRRKAQAAGESTKEFASEHAGDSGKIGKQARLAQTLMGMKKKKSPLYDAKKD